MDHQPDGTIEALNAVSEETAPRSQNQRVDQEHVLVDEVAPHQRLDQLSAAE